MTREEKERLVDEYATGAMNSRQRHELFAAAAGDNHLRALLDADTAIVQGIERDRRRLAEDDARPGVRLLTKLAASSPAQIPMAAAGSRLSNRDITLAIAIMAALIGIMVGGTHLDSQEEEPDRSPTPAIQASPTTAAPFGAIEPSPATARGVRPPSTSPRVTSRTARPVRRRPDAGATPATPSQTVGDHPRVDAPQQSAAPSATQPAAPPPVFNEDKVRFEVNVEKKE